MNLIGLFAAGFIAAGSDISYYCGKLMSEAEIDDEAELRCQGRYAIDFDLKDFPDYLHSQSQQQSGAERSGVRGGEAAAVSGGPAAASGAAPASLIAASRGVSSPSSTASVGAPRDKSNRVKIVDHEVHMLVMDASLHRNEMAFMNDYRWAPLGGPPVTAPAATAEGGAVGGTDVAAADEDEAGVVVEAWRRRPNVDTYTSMQHFVSRKGATETTPPSASAGDECVHLLLAPCSLLLAPCSLILAPCSLLLDP